MTGLYVQVKLCIYSLISKVHELKKNVLFVWIFIVSLFNILVFYDVLLLTCAILLLTLSSVNNKTDIFCKTIIVTDEKYCNRLKPLIRHLFWRKILALLYCDMSKYFLLGVQTLNWIFIPGIFNLRL